MTSNYLHFQLSVDLFCIARDGYFVEVNPAWTHTLGWDEQELKSRPFVEFVHPDDRARTKQEEMKIIQGNGDLRFENRYRTKSGHYRWLQWTSREFPGGIAAVARDITEEKAQVMALQESRRQTMFLHFLVENTYDPIYLLSPSQGFRLAYVNQAACRHFGKSREELMKMAIPDWDDNYSFSECETFWRKLKAQKTCTIQTRHRVFGEKIVPVEVSCSYFKFGDEEFIGGYIRDSTDRRKNEANLESFAYAVSHDLQEPLRTITSYLKILERKISNIPEVIEYIEFAKGAALRMRQLIEGLLAYSKLTRDRTDFREEVDLNEVVRSATENLRQKIIESQANIQFEELPSVMGNRVLLTQIFQNLFDNAIKYQGKNIPVIIVSALQSDFGWLVSVRDNGIGIQQSDRERIFNVFQRLHSRHEYSGIGVGLAICRRAVELMGGTIWVTSQPGTGSSFHFTLPRRSYGELPGPAEQNLPSSLSFTANEV